MWILVFAIGLVIIYSIFFQKRFKKNKKPVILQIGPSLEDKGGMVTMMEQIVTSKLKDKYHIIHLQTYIVGDKYRLFIKAIGKFILYAIKYNIQVVHIHTASKGSFYRKSIFIKLSKIAKAKIILHAHGAGFQEFYKQSKRKKYIRKTLKNVDKLIVLSNSWKEFYKTLIEENKIEVIYNSIDIPENIEKKKTNETQGIFLGRLGKRKGIYDLIDTVENLVKEEYEFKITIAGDGEIEEVKKIIHEKKLEKYFDVVGWISKEQREKLFEKAEFLILPSYHEGLPMAILEAMSRKIAVISTYVGGIPEVIKNEENGLLSNPGDLKALANHLRIVLKDKEKARNIANKGYETVKKQFNKVDLIHKIDEIYEELRDKNIKLCLASSAGGHFMQLKQLLKMAEKYDYFIATEKNTISIPLKNKHKMKFLVQQERKNIDFVFKFGINILKSIGIIFIKRPDVIISTGAGATFLLCLLTKIIGGKVIFIESFAKIKSPTVTGQKVYKFADEFYVQWEEMLQFYPKAHYKGGIY